MAAITENYQLKWHSFGSHLHSCVASSLINSNFSDVCLSTFDGHQISAHRFVLSASSQYLHQVLKIQSKVTTALPLLIILPPEINYNTMKVLIQYMYSGETTVSKDILESVLRGGDLLKVRGLWRPPERHETELIRTNKQLEKKTASSYSTSIPIPKLIHFDSSKNSSEITPVVENNTNNISRKNEQNGNKKLQNSTSSTTSNEKKGMITRKKIHERSRKQIFPSEAKTNQSEESNKKECSKNVSENLEFFVIKEEPLEWNEENDETELVEEDNHFDNEMTVKPEIITEDNSENSKSEELYTPLTCELCTESFAHPGDWVKHIQSHTDMLPAKRQRRGRSYTDEENSSFPPLHCDLCLEYFSTPAEWVRHIEDCHTEFELRLSNTNNGKPVKIKATTSEDGQKVCDICNKKFPSHASMLIHKRTHTGEKPYMCEYCNKGFNVKSNLLRHLRTLHDKIISPTDIDHYKEDDKHGGESSGTSA